jgi:SAM-dependent methyltransferase
MRKVDAPSAWVVRFEPLFRRHGRILDVAAGSGRHVRFLTSQGHQVTAVDRDLAALQQSDAVRLVHADLELGVPVLSDETFDAVVVTNYLHRPLFAGIANWLADDGVLVYETFARGQEAFGRPSNPDFLLAPGELLAAFSQLRVVAYEFGVEQLEAPRCVQRICAVRRSTAQLLSGFTARQPGPSLSPSQIR